MSAPRVAAAAEPPSPLTALAVPPPLREAAIRSAVAHLASRDRVLAAIIARVGPCALRHAEPDFETMVRNIVYQQLSGRVALAIFGRLKAAAGGNGRLRPETVLALDSAALRRLGLSGRKARYVRDLAEKTAAGLLDFGALAGLPDDAVIERLTQVTGVGAWTAQMFLIFALHRPDVLPVGDLGIRTAARKLYRLRALPSAARLTRLARPWRPYASVACWYLWRSLERPGAL
ncbi:MAG TPA: DNA-3-methyladenine glycosylase [Candidatus Sulfotelmatobacter sp.]|nr:DNA-3-methyladenine glycosylase [Candidatus Sulfotelmatobacter sp.]